VYQNMKGFSSKLSVIRATEGVILTRCCGLIPFEAVAETIQPRGVIGA